MQHNPHYPHHHNMAQRTADGARRSTRSVSKPRHVEVLLVADKSMTDFHDQSNLETYLLTIMNMVRVNKTSAFAFFFACTNTIKIIKVINNFNVKNRIKFLNLFYIAINVLSRYRHCIWTLQSVIT